MYLMERSSASNSTIYSIVRGGGMILGEVKARPKDIISFSLDYISKSKVQTSNPSSSPISLDTPARPADSVQIIHTQCT